LVHPDRRRASAAPISSPIPLEQLVEDVYASSGPDIQRQMLARLVNKVYETAPAPLQSLAADEEQVVRPAEIVALVEHALQAGGAALGRLTRLLANSPPLTGSGAAAVLVALLRRTHRRRAGDLTKVD